MMLASRDDWTGYASSPRRFGLFGLLFWAWFFFFWIVPRSYHWTGHFYDQHDLS